MSNTQVANLESPAHRRRSWWLLAVVAVLVLSTAGSVAFLVTRQSPLEAAQQRCNPSGDYTSVADGGRTLVINHAGRSDHRGVTTEVGNCLLDQLGVTTAVVQHMRETRLLDGRQEGSWDGFRASWTYDPEDGLDIVVEVA